MVFVKLPLLPHNVALEVICILAPHPQPERTRRILICLRIREPGFHQSGGCVKVEGVLTITESQQFIDAAERTGFEHQSSRGPAFGEVPPLPTHPPTRLEPSLCPLFGKVVGTSVEARLQLHLPLSLLTPRQASQGSHNPDSDSGSYSPMSISFR